MSKEKYSNQTTVKAMHRISEAFGELFQGTRLTIRGKGEKESRVETFDAIFSFYKPLLCSESEVPLGGGYFLTSDGRAEVTQLIGRFDTATERSEWIIQTLELHDAEST